MKTDFREVSSIILPEKNREKWEDLMNQVFSGADNCFSGLCQLSNIEDFQKEPKNWPNHTNIPEYCLYLGSIVCPRNGPVDLYHYHDFWNDHYSTGIVFGDDDSNYQSGWVGIRLHDMEHGGIAYNELWLREYECGLLKDEWISEEAQIGLAKQVREQQMKRIQEKTNEQKANQQ